MKVRTRRRMYLGEATIMLVGAQLAVRFASAAQLFAWAGRPPLRINRFNDEKVGWVSWAVETMSEKRWIQAHSLSRALAAQAMLRRRGIASRLCIGVVCKGEGLTSHAWVERDQEIVIGAAGAACTRLAEFGGERASRR
jgi:hypothetical protein